MGRFAHQVKQRLVARAFAACFIGNEYEPNLLCILVGCIGCDLDKPCQWPASCRSAQAHQPSDLLSPEVLRI